MQFLNAPILWGLIALAIPVIVHLFYFRRYKKVPFTNVALLKEVVQESATRNRLKHYLILLSRLLALVALILAFAQPIKNLWGDQVQGRDLVTLFIDNSYSMEAQSTDGRSFDRARTIAKTVIQSLSETARIQLITRDLAIPERRWMDQQYAQEYIDQISISPNATSFSSIFNSIRKLHSSEDGKHTLYVLSDFPESEFSQVMDIDSSWNLQFMPLRTESVQNISIDSAYFINPTLSLYQSNPLIVEMTNHGSQDRTDIKLNYTLGTKNSPAGLISLPAAGQLKDTINIEFNEGGWQAITINIQDNPIVFDDRYYLGLNIVNNVNILTIKNPITQWNIKKAFDGLAYINFTESNIGRVNYGDIPEQNLVILQGVNELSSGLSSELNKYVNNGGNLFIIPHQELSSSSYSEFLTDLGIRFKGDLLNKQLAIGRINTRSTVFRNVYDRSRAMLDLPSTTNYFPLGRGRSATESLLFYRDGTSALNRYSSGEGNVFFLGMPVNNNSSDFNQYVELWLPMIYNMGLYSTEQQITQCIIGQACALDVKRTSTAQDLIYKVSGNSSFIPKQTNIPNGQRIFIGDELKESGIYRVELDKETMAIVGMNSDRNESSLNFMSDQELKETWPTASVQDVETDTAIAALAASQGGEGTHWRMLLILAGLFLLIESALIRWLK